MMRNEDPRCQLARRTWKQRSKSCCFPGDRGFWLAVQVGGGSWVQGPDIRTLRFSLLRLTLIAIVTSGVYLRHWLLVCACVMPVCAYVHCVCVCECVCFFSIFFL